MLNPYLTTSHRRTARALIAAAAIGMPACLAFAQDKPVEAAGGAAGEANGAEQPVPTPTPAPAPGPAAVVHPTDTPSDSYVFSAFSEPVELTLLVSLVRDDLGIPILATDAGLTGQKVVLNAPITVPRDKVLQFLTFLLETKNYTLVRGPAGIYVVQPVAEAGANVGVDEFNTTRIIPTKGLRPTSLQSALAPLGITIAQPGVPAQPGRGAGAMVAFMDELGALVVTGSPRQTAQITEMVERLVAEQDLIKPVRVELQYVAASFARDRVLEMSGGGNAGALKSARTGTTPGAAAVPMMPGTSIFQFDDRLTIDPQSNSLYFRGRENEIKELRKLLASIDVPNSLLSKYYPVGRASRAVAAEGQRQGLGEVTTEDSGSDMQNLAARQQFQQFAQVAAGAAGPGFIIYPDIGGFMYRGTPQQHERVARMVADLGALTEQELIVVEFYKLKHSKSEDVADLIQNLIANQLPAGNNPLLGTDQRRNTRTPNQPNQPAQPNQPVNPAAAADAATGGSLAAIQANEDVFVLPDKANNQVVVKAPRRLQPQFARLIEKLDLRRPQVYVDVKIVAVTASDDFRLAFETQLLSGDFTWNTNFGLSQFPTGVDLDNKKSVLTSLLGATAAYIRSDQVPIVINALQQVVDTHILSTPQLLVDDNEEASVDSVNKQPYSTTTQTTGNPQQTSFGGDAEAGTKLKLKPQISEGDYLKLDYEVELSAFTGEAQNSNVPPPSQVNKIASKSVTVPSDTTIVVGGLSFEQTSNTVFKVPFIGDIPYIGQLFRDERKSTRKTTLYVFITPKIMKDPTFADLRLLTTGPAKDVRLPDDAPPSPTPARIDFVEPTGRGPAPASPSVSRGGK